MSKWIMWPPPFNFPPAAIGFICVLWPALMLKFFCLHLKGPLGLYTLFFKFYDMLSSFTAPSSYIMSTANAIKVKSTNFSNFHYFCPGISHVSATHKVRSSISRGNTQWLPNQHYTGLILFIFALKYFFRPWLQLRMVSILTNRVYYFQVLDSILYNSCFSFRCCCFKLFSCAFVASNWYNECIGYSPAFLDPTNRTRVTGVVVEDIETGNTYSVLG